jgi:hypothetical protein
LSRTSEEKLEMIMKEGNMGDAVYYWAILDMDLNLHKKLPLDFWSLCDNLNAGHCRYFCFNKLMIYFFLFEEII